ncbi:MAG: hypothetical protein KAV00_07130 [Phycisphaerae bacterium]|nr:hypothetical protein [Phycisphaerae bacterium]
MQQTDNSELPPLGKYKGLYPLYGARQCPVCNDKIEPGGGSICFGCRLDKYLPPNYEKHEQYVFVKAYGHSNATRRPPTGKPILDTPSGPRIYKFILKLPKKTPVPRRYLYSVGV